MATGSKLGSWQLGKPHLVSLQSATKALAQPEERLTASNGGLLGTIL